MKNKRQFEQIFRDNYTRLYYHALNFLNDSEAAYDVVNDVFEYVWTHYEQFKFDKSITPLLYTLVRNHSVNIVRRQRVEEKYQQKMQLETDFYEQDYEEYEAFLQRLRNAITQLPPQTQTIFTACFLEGKKYLEVGHELGISVNTVKTHISKALRILREGFAGEKLVLLTFFIYRNRRAAVQTRLDAVLHVEDKSVSLFQ